MFIHVVLRMHSNSEILLLIALCEGALQKAVALRQHIVHTTVQSPHGAQYILPDVYLGHISLIALVSRLFDY